MWKNFTGAPYIAEVNLLVVGTNELAAVADTGPQQLESLDVIVWPDEKRPDVRTTIALTGQWQTRCGEAPTDGETPEFATLPLPAIYGASPDILFEP
jgi:hypothetical protein